MKQTAVQWIEEQLIGVLGLDLTEHQLKMFNEVLITQAKEMEEEQIVDAIIHCEKEHIIQANCYPPQFVVDKAKKYYKQTFKNDLQD